MRRTPPGTHLVAAIGVGSVFEVASVRDATGRELLAKRLHAGTRALAAGATALRRERDVLRAAGGANLPELIASGDDEAGAFLLETLAPGEPLRKLLDPRRPLDAARWTATACAVSRSLAALHALRDRDGALEIVHGDLSPDNIFFVAPWGSTAAGEARVTFVDLSSSTFRDAREPAFAADRGTLPYVAPEVARGERRADSGADTYALAATLLALAVGTIADAVGEAAMLYEVGTHGLLRSRLAGRADLPEEARRALAHALAPDRASRLLDSGELARSLERGC